MTKKSDFSNVRTGSSTVQGGGGGGGNDFDNVRTGSSTVQGGGATGSQTTYTVEKGDTLSAIAQQFYGKAGQWNAIFEANRDQIDDPDRIFPGQVLKIPVQGGST